jgi:hypothetical protein
MTVHSIGLDTTIYRSGMAIHSLTVGTGEKPYMVVALHSGGHTAFVLIREAANGGLTLAYLRDLDDLDPELDTAGRDRTEIAEKFALKNVDFGELETTLKDVYVDVTGRLAAGTIVSTIVPPVR